MTDTGIYIIESDASVSGVAGPRHLGLLIVKDGISTFIDGGQSQGFLIDAEEVPVDELQSQSWSQKLRQSYKVDSAGRNKERNPDYDNDEETEPFARVQGESGA